MIVKINQLAEDCLVFIQEVEVTKLCLLLITT